MGSVLDSVRDFTSNFIQNEELNLKYLSYGMVSFGVISFVLLQFFPSPYGRHGSAQWGWLVNSNFAWFTQELPAFCVPVALTLWADCPQLNTSANKVLFGMYTLHYFHRALIYPLLIRGGKPSPFIPYSMALCFCTANGYLQGRSVTRFVSYPGNWLNDPRFIIGISMFLVGMGANLHSDHVLRNLRKPGESGYKIPTGGLFEFVSGANFLGEIVEWAGFACASWSLPALAFSFFTFSNLVPRAIQHHRWYKQKFEDYPKNRKAIIPFLL